MHIPHRFPSGVAYCGVRERRLAKFRETLKDHQEDDDMGELLEKSQQTGGRMNRAPVQDEMEGETRELLKKIGKTRVGWKAWFNNFFRSNAARDARNYNILWNAAKREIDQRGNLAVGRIRGIFQQSKRKLYLKALDEVLQRKATDLDSYVKSEIADRAKGMRGIANDIRSSGPVAMNAKHRERVRASLGRIKVKNTVKVDPKTKKVWTEAIAKERDIADKLLRFGIVEDTYEADVMIGGNRSGYRTLERIIRKTDKLDGDEDMRTELLGDLRKVRDGTSRYSQVYRGLQGDPNIGNVRKRLNSLRKDPDVFDRNLRFAPDGAAPEDAKVTYCQNGMLTARTPSGTDYVVSLKTGKFTGRDGNGNAFEGRLNERNFLIIT